MQALQLTLDDSAGNIALDEALLEQAEHFGDRDQRGDIVPNEAGTAPEVFRLWEPRKTIVVLGRSSPLEREVNLEYCERNNIDIVRRCSGGATIVTGPGCLMYAVLLDYRKREPLRMLENAHHFVMEQTRLAIAKIGINVTMQGTSDLTLGDRKFSGNSLRCKRNWLVYHGTILCDFDTADISKCLGTPIRQPEYRLGRTHDEFLTTLPCRVEDLRPALLEQWGANSEMADWPEQLTRKLVDDKYSRDEWTYKVR
jgi:lipoate-protein ligase A